MAKKKNKAAANLPAVFLLIIMTFVLIAWFVGTLLKTDRTEISPNGLYVNSDESSTVLNPAQTVDINRLTQNFTYVSIDSQSINSGLLATGGESDALTAKDLQPVYNAVFSSDGLQIASVKNSRLKCRSEMINPLSQMLQAFYTQTNLRTIMINSAYEQPEDESENEQSGVYYDEYGNMYDEYGNYLGYYYNQTDETPEETEICAEHSDGYSLDLGLYIEKNDGRRDFTGTGDYAWFEKNASRFGFILRYPDGKEDITGISYNPAHFRYVGIAVATILTQNNLALEELSDFVSGYSFSNPLEVSTDEGEKVVYYIEDSGYETTDVRIPTDSLGNIQPYTISGDGKNGYIIIVSPTEDFSLDDSSEDNSTENATDIASEKY